MKPVGYQFLIKHFELVVLLPYKKSFIAKGAIRIKNISSVGEEEYFPSKYQVGDTWQEHLVFALKYEGVNLEVMKALFQMLKPENIIDFIKSKRTGVYMRKIWFFYEFLLQTELPLAPLSSGNYVPALPPDNYFTLDATHSIRAKRQRIVNNLPGNAEFCPIVRLTGKIRNFQAMKFHDQVTQMLGAYPTELIYRASQFLYLKETKSSYAIERLSPDQMRISKFMGLLQQAGENTIEDAQSLVQLQNIIVDERYAAKDYRDFQVYIGQSITPGYEIVHFIAPKPDVVHHLMNGFLKTVKMLLNSNMDPIITAAVVGFGFVFLHPFEDGNGRLHRYLLHHVLAKRKFSPVGLIFPVSAVMYKNQRQYDSMLESFSKKLMPFIKYHLDEDGGMTVLNDTADFYRFINFTMIAEELYSIVEATLKTELIPELDYLLAWDRVREKMRNIVDMPEAKTLKFITFVQQNKGTLPKRRRDLFSELTDDEIQKLSQVISAELLNDRNFDFHNIGKI
jgi:hypothetical protein